MTKPTDSEMNHPGGGPLTACQKQIELAMMDLRKALEHAKHATAETPEQREFIEADICLTSRSAYFDFFTWLVLHGEVDAAAEAELDHLFQSALKVMQTGRFKESVESRYKEFKAECRHVRDGLMESASSVDA